MLLQNLTIKYYLLIIILSLFVINSYSNANTSKHYHPTLETSFRVGNIRNIGRLGMLVPIVESNKGLLFSNIFGLLDSSSNNEGNLGIGYRHMFNDDYILGSYMFYDYRKSEYKNRFNQITLGAEYLRANFESRINVYLPINNKERVLGQEIKRVRKGYFLLLENTKRFEKALSGFDIEVGGNLPRFDPLEGYLSYYYFNESKFKPVHGIRLRSILKLNEYISLEGEISHDRLRKKQSGKNIILFGGIRLSYTFGKKEDTLSRLEKKMTQMIIRDIDVINDGKEEEETEAKIQEEKTDPNEKKEEIKALISVVEEFKELGLRPNATKEDKDKAKKRLLKKHYLDIEKCNKLNEAGQILDRWFDEEVTRIKTESKYYPIKKNIRDNQQTKKPLSLTQEGELREERGNKSELITSFDEYERNKGNVQELEIDESDFSDADLSTYTDLPKVELKGMVKDIKGTKKRVRELLESACWQLSKEEQKTLSGREEVLMLMIEEYPTVLREKSKDGWTPVLAAAENGLEKVLMLMIEKYPDGLTDKSKDGWTPALIAAAKGLEEALALMIKKYPKVLKDKDKDGRTPAIIAAENGQEGVLVLMIEKSKGDVLKDKDKDGCTPALIAAEEKLETVLMLMIEEYPEVLRDKNEYGHTPALWAAEKGLEKALKLIIKHNPEALEDKNDHGWTPALMAAITRLDESVILMIEKYPKVLDVFVNDGNGWQLVRSVLWAIENGYEKALMLIIDACPKIVDECYAYNYEPLSIIVAENGLEKVLMLLIEKYPNVITDSYHYTNLGVIAAKQGLKQALMLMIEKYPRVLEALVKDRDGRKGLRDIAKWATENGHEKALILMIETYPKVLEHLFAHGNDWIRLRDIAYWAAENGYEKALMLMIEKYPRVLEVRFANSNTLAIIAAKRGQEKALMLMIEKNPMVLADKNTYGSTPAIWAAENGLKQALRLMINRYPKVLEDKNTLGSTPATRAAGKGLKKVLTLMIEANPKVLEDLVKDRDGWSWLLDIAKWASANGDKKALMIMIEEYPKVLEDLVKDEHGWRRFIVIAKWAAENGHEKALMIMIEQSPQVLEELVKENGSGWWLASKARWAAENGHEKALRLMIEKDPKVLDVHSSDSGNTLAIIVAKKGLEKLLMLMIEKSKGDVLQEKDDDGNTLALIAAHKGLEKALRLMMETKPRVLKDKSENGNTPALIVAEKGLEEVLISMIKTDPKVLEDRGYSGNTPAIISAEKGLEKVLEFMIENHPKVLEDKDADDWRTPAIIAAEKGLEKLLMLMIEKYPKVLEDESYSGKTPAIIVEEKGQEKVLEFMLEDHPKVLEKLVKDKYGCTPAIWAAKKCHKKLLMLMIKKDPKVLEDKDTDGNTPAIIAVEKGLEKVLTFINKVRFIHGLKDEDIGLSESLKKALSKGMFSDSKASSPEELQTWLLEQIKEEVFKDLTTGSIELVDAGEELHKIKSKIAELLPNMVGKSEKETKEKEKKHQVALEKLQTNLNEKIEKTDSLIEMLERKISNLECAFPEEIVAIGEQFDKLRGNVLFEQFLVALEANDIEGMEGLACDKRLQKKDRKSAQTQMGEYMYAQGMREKASKYLPGKELEIKRRDYIMAAHNTDWQKKIDKEKFVEFVFDNITELESIRKKKTSFNVLLKLFNSTKSKKLIEIDEMIVAFINRAKFLLEKDRMIYGDLLKYENELVVFKLRYEDKFNKQASQSSSSSISSEDPVMNFLDTAIKRVKGFNEAR